MRSAILLLLAFMSLCTRPIFADTLYEQSRITITGSNAIGVSSTSPIDFVNEYSSRTYDNFTLADDSQLTGIGWVGAFSGPFNPSSDPQFRSDADFAIEIFGDSAGAPNLSNSIFSMTLEGGKAGLDDSSELGSSTVAGAQQRDGGAVLDYSASIPSVDLSAGSYWLSIESSQNHPSGDDFLDPDWLWVRGTGGDNLLYNFDEQFGDTSQPGMAFSSGCPDPCDTAFTLLGTATNSGLLGDFDDNGLLEDNDIDLLSAEIRAGTNNAEFDLNGDDVVNATDHTVWVEDVFGTFFGDADLNREVKFADFLLLANSFGLPGGWGSGDFDASGDVAFADFLRLSNNFGNEVAFAAGEPGVASVPEPSTLLTLTLGLVLVTFLKNGERNRKNT